MVKNYKFLQSFMYD